MGAPMWASIFSGVAWAAAAWALLLVMVSALVSILPSASTDIVSLGAVHILVLGGVSYALAWASERKVVESKEASRWAVVLGLHDPRAGALVIGLAVGFLAKLPADGLRTVIEYWFPTGEMDVIHQMRLLRHDTLGETLALFVIIGFTGPLLEEVFYRGVLFRRIAAGAGLLGAWIVTSLMFTVSHGAIRDWPSLLVVALALGFLRGVFGTIWASLSAHVAFNSSTLAALVLGYQSIDEGGPPSVPLMVGGAMGVIALLMFARRFFHAPQ